MKKNEIELLLQLVKVKKTLKSTPNEKLFIALFEKFDGKPNVLHESLSIIARE